jgi:(p)ppGpp synthase/HD superfamily hydrolase
VPSRVTIEREADVDGRFGDLSYACANVGSKGVNDDQPDKNTPLDAEVHRSHGLRGREARHPDTKGRRHPYLGHLLSVAGYVIEAGGTETEAIAALLHDTAEDQGGEETLAEIRQKFGADVASVVAECSDTFETPKPPWRERKEN